MSITPKGPGGGENVTPEVTEQSSIIDSIMTSLVGKVTEANATPETILEGYKAWVNGELIEGTMEDASKKICYGTIIPASDQSSITVDHTLGVNPTYMAIFSPSIVDANHTIAVFDNWYAYKTSGEYVGSGGRCGKTESTATFNAYNNFQAGKTYIWLVMA